MYTIYANSHCCMPTECTPCVCVCVLCVCVCVCVYVCVHGLEHHSLGKMFPFTNISQDNVAISCNVYTISGLLRGVHYSLSCASPVVDVDNLSTSQLSNTFTKNAHREKATIHAHTLAQICTCMHARMYTPPHIRYAS